MSWDYTSYSNSGHQALKGTVYSTNWGRAARTGKRRPAGQGSADNFPQDSSQLTQSPEDPAVAGRVNANFQVPIIQKAHI